MLLRARNAAGPGPAIGPQSARPLHGICARTPAVRDALVARLSSATNCAEVSAAQLAGVTGSLDLSDVGLTTLAAGDLHGLTALAGLDLGDNELSELPPRVFADLRALATLDLQRNRLRELPAQVFADLRALATLDLQRNRLRELPAQVFAGLQQVTTVNLSTNRIGALPAGAFAGLAELRALHLDSNDLHALPAGAFAGVAGLHELTLHGNPGTPFTLPFALRRDGRDGFRAVVEHGAPTELRAGFSISGGEPADGVLTVPAGAAASERIVVTASEPGVAPVVRLSGAAALPSTTYVGVRTAVGGLPVTITAVPAAPAELVAAGGNRTIVLRWSAAGDASITGYETRLRPAGAGWGAWRPVAGSGASTTGHRLRGLVNGTAYAVQVRARNVIGASATSAPAGATPRTGNSPPTFGGAARTRTVAENSVAGAPVGPPVAALDGDGDALTYSLAGADADAFTIAAGGQIQVGDQTALDYESPPATYAVVVQVADGMAPDGSADPTVDDSVAVTIAVRNVPEPVLTALAFTSTPATPGHYQRIGAAIEVTATFTEAVTVTGTPRLPLVLSATERRYAEYAEGSGSTALRFRYTVQDGDDSAGAPIAVAADSLELHDGSIRTGSADAVLDHPALAPADAVAAHRPRVDAGQVRLPVAASIDADGDGVADTYVRDDAVSVAVGLTAPVTVDDGGANENVRIVLAIGDAERTLTYEQTTDAEVWFGPYLVAAEDLDADGVVIVPDAAGNLIRLAGGATMSAPAADGGNEISSAHAAIELGDRSRVRGSNTAPLATDFRRTTASGADLTFRTDDFGFVDVDGDPLRTVRIVSLAAPGTAGTLRSGAPPADAPVTAGHEVAAADLDTGTGLWFRPASGFGGEATFTFATIDPFGATSADATATIRVGVLPAAPTGLVATAGDRSIMLSWIDPDDDSITGYEVSTHSGGEEWGRWLAVAGSGAGTTGHELTGLRDGAAYQVRIRARNGAGAGAPSAPASAVARLDVCGRTPQVREAIVRMISGVADCAAVTAADLAAVTGTLNLSDQGITALRAGDFGGLASLTTLDLSGNDLAALPGGLFTGLAALVRLDLGGNELRTVTAGVFGGLAALARLDLGDNHLQSLPRRSFGGLAALTDLDLSGNDLTALPGGLLAELIALARLDLAENHLSTLPAGLLGTHGAGGPTGLARLARLDLSGNELGALPAELFDGLAALAWLDLSGNELGVLPAELFGGPAALAWLDLSGNRLTTLPADLFDGLGALARLYLHDNLLLALPDGLFRASGLLAELRLDENPGAPFTLTLELAQDGEGFTVRVATGAPFAMSARFAVDGGAPSSGTVTVAAGADRAHVAVARAAKREPLVTLDADVLPSGARGLRTAVVGSPLVMWAVPAAPAGLSGRPSDGSIVLSWHHPVDASITGYEVQTRRGEDGWAEWTAIDGSDAGTASHLLTDLDNDTTYRVRIRARNAAGSGAASDAVSATPGAGICTRTPAVRAALLAGIGATECATVTAAQLAAVTGSLSVSAHRSPNCRRPTSRDSPAWYGWT